MAVWRLRRRVHKVSNCDFSTSDQIIEVVHQGTVITSGLPQQIKATIHYKPLQTKLIKDNAWEATTFDSIDCDAYLAAITSIQGTQCISISNLSHGLWNTNSQNCKFYGLSALCPIFKTADESLEHVFTCPAPQAQKCREEACSALYKALAGCNTPTPLVDLILKCIQSSLNITLLWGPTKKPERSSSLLARETCVRAHQ